MNRLLIWTVLTGCLFGLPPGALAQDGSRADRAARRAAERAERDQERAARAQQRAEQRARRNDGGAHILLGQDFELGEGATSPEKVIVLGGSATINGHVEDDLVVVGGSIHLGPTSIVDGDVSVVGGELDRDAAAQVDGDVHVAHVSLPWNWNWAWGLPVGLPSIGRLWWQGAALAFTIGRIVLILLLSMMLVAVAPRRIASIAAQFVSAPGVSTVCGFGAEILFAPALICVAVVMIITIVGIPLLAALPLLVAAFALMWVAGYAAVAGVLGARLRGTDWYLHGVRPIDVFLGSIVLSSLTIVGQVLLLSGGWLAPLAFVVRSTGWFIEYMAWTMGLGAALVAWLRPGGFNPGSIPPVVPPLPSPSPTAF